jgi:hypothetical protein
MPPHDKLKIGPFGKLKKKLFLSDTTELLDNKLGDKFPWI